MERASEESKADVNFIVDEIDQLSRGSKSDRHGGSKTGRRIQSFTSLLQLLYVVFGDA